MALNEREYRKRMEALQQKAKANKGPDKQIRAKQAGLREQYGGKGGFKVNPDPRPPNEPKPNKGGQSNVHQNGGKKPNKPNKGAGPAGGNQVGGTTPYDPGKAPDPRDEQYWQDVTRLNFEKNNSLNQLNSEQVFANTSYEEGQANLARERPKAILGNTEAANDAGALYSSKTLENQGEIEQGFFQSQSDLSRNYQADTSSRSMMAKALEQGYTIDEANALSNSVGRTSEAAMSRPSPVSPNILKQLEKLTAGKKTKGKGKGSSSQNGKPKNSSNQRLKALQKQYKTAKGAEKTRLRKRIRKLKNGSQKQK